MTLSISDWLPTYLKDGMGIAVFSCVIVIYYFIKFLSLNDDYKNRYKTFLKHHVYIFATLRRIELLK